MPPITLTTPRLVIRSILESDALELFAACSDARLTETTIFETHRTMEDTNAFVAQVTGPMRNPHGAALAMTAGGRVVGSCGFLPVPGTTHAVEIGYWVAVPEWGRGYATEAAERLVEYVFQNPATYRVQARVFAGNAGSVRVLEKLGFRYEGTQRAAIFRRSKMIDILMFAKLRGE